MQPGVQWTSECEIAQPGHLNEGMLQQDCEELAESYKDCWYRAREKGLLCPGIASVFVCNCGSGDVADWRGILQGFGLPGISLYYNSRGKEQIAHNEV